MFLFITFVNLLRMKHQFKDHLYISQRYSLRLKRNYESILFLLFFFVQQGRYVERKSTTKQHARHATRIKVRRALRKTLYKNGVCLFACVRACICVRVCAVNSFLGMFYDQMLSRITPTKYTLTFTRVFYHCIFLFFSSFCTSDWLIFKIYFCSFRARFRRCHCQFDYGSTRRTKRQS